MYPCRITPGGTSITEHTRTCKWLRNLGRATPVDCSRLFNQMENDRGSCSRPIIRSITCIPIMLAICE